MKISDFAFLDVETTGTRPTRGDRIIEIACVGHSMIDFATAVRLDRGAPENRDLPDWYTKLLSNQDLPSFRQIAPEVLRRLESRTIVGHNVTFDLEFLSVELEELHAPIRPLEFVDTLPLARDVLPHDQAESYGLQELARNLPVEKIGRAHRASSDARQTKKLFELLISRLECRDCAELPIRRYTVS